LQRAREVPYPVKDMSVDVRGLVVEVEIDGDEDVSGFSFWFLGLSEGWTNDLACRIFMKEVRLLSLVVEWVARGDDLLGYRVIEVV